MFVEIVPFRDTHLEEANKVQMVVLFGRFYKKVWPLSPLFGANFIKKML